MERISIGFRESGDEAAGRTPGIHRRRAQDPLASKEKGSMKQLVLRLVGLAAPFAMFLAAAAPPIRW